MKTIGWKSLFAFVALFLPACSGSHGGSTSATQAPRELFAFPARFFVGPGVPGQLARGDLDGDRVVDIAVPLTDPSGAAPPSVVLSYLDRLGHPSRTVELKDASHPVEVEISDCNSDGRADVLVLDEHGEDVPGEVLVHLQAVDGTFGVPLHFAVGVEPIRLIAARWDADRTLDLLAVHQQESSVCVLAGRGDGTFEPARFTEHGVVDVRDADAGDLDNDGALDLALVHSYGAFLLFGSGDGGFGTPQHFSTEFYDNAVRVADVTGEGFLDILRTNCNGLGLRVLEGDGTGSFAPGFTFVTGCYVGPEIGDLDGDGIVDMLVGGITPLLGLGGGDFVPGPSFSPGVGSQADLALWDVDADLDLDMVSVGSVGDSAHLTTDLTLLAGKGDGTFEGPGQYPAGPEGRAVVVGDFVRDGVSDLAVLQYPPALSVLGGVGDGSFVASIDTPLALGPGPVGLLGSADLDGNTLEDLLVGNGNFTGEEDELLLLSSTGAGTFDVPFSIPSGGLASAAVRVADLDSDLLPDLIVSLVLSNQIAVHLGMPGGFSQPLLFGVGASPVDLELDDLDGDGILDAVVPNYDDDTASVLIGNGDGTFLPASAVPTSNGPWELETGDFDEDGLDDLVVACPGNAATRSEIHGEIVLLSGMGDGTFTSRQLLPVVADGVFQLIAADLNRDGHLDLVTASRFAVFVQIANGPASYEPRRTFMLDAGIGGMEVSDLDADGKQDLVVAAGSRALVFLNQGP